MKGHRRPPASQQVFNNSLYTHNSTNSKWCLSAHPLGSAVRQSSLQCAERLLKVGNNIINVLSANRYTDSILGGARIKLLLVGQLLMGGGPGVNGQGLGVANTRRELDHAI